MATSAVTLRPRSRAWTIRSTDRADEMRAKCALTPVCSMSARSRAMMTVSAASGTKKQKFDSRFKPPTKGQFKEGGLVGQGHNDMRKGGLFK